MRALYAAIERNEDHAATISTLLSALHAEFERARGDARERRRIAVEMAYYVRKRAELHAERDALRQEITKLRQGR